MDWTILGPALLTLAGGLVGTAASFTTGFYTTRTTRDQARRQQHEAARAELKEAVLEYIKAFQNCQDTFGKIGESAVRADLADLREEAGRQNSEVWFYQKKLSLLADDDLRAASLALTKKVDEAMYGGERSEGTDIWEHTESAQENFLARARVSLGMLQSVATTMRRPPRRRN